MSGDGAGGRGEPGGGGAAGGEGGAAVDDGEDIVAKAGQRSGCAFGCGQRVPAVPSAEGGEGGEVVLIIFF